MAAGRGQDFYKYIENKVDNLLMVDNDLNALQEIINRKHKYIRNNNEKHLCSIGIACINLQDNYIDVSKTILQKFPSKAQLVICNMAVHYFTGNKKKIRNFVNLLNTILIKGGTFICTAFNGSVVHKALSDGMFTNSKYSIKPKAEK